MFKNLSGKAQENYLTFLEKLEATNANAETSYYCDYDAGKREIFLSINVTTVKCNNGQELEFDGINVELCFTEINNNHNVKLGYESNHNIYLDELKAHNDVYRAFEKVWNVTLEYVLSEIERTENQYCDCYECQQDRYCQVQEDALDAIRNGD